MTAMSRRKGANGEREFRDLLRSHGFTCERDGSERGDLIHDVPGVHFEVKRRETYELAAWLRQATADALAKALRPVVAFRKSHQPWRVVVDADEYLRLKAMERRIGHITPERQEDAGELLQFSRSIPERKAA